MADTSFNERVAALRRFNRFYTQKIGVLDEGLLRSAFSLSQARVLYEIAFCGRLTAAQLGKELGLDRGYLSRILRGFERRVLIRRTTSTADRRVALLELTEQGRAAFTALDARSQTETGMLLAGLPEEEQTQLVGAVDTIERVLGAAAEDRGHYLLRPHRAGDLGWIVSRHGALYAEEYGWNSGFEALVAEIAAKFLHKFNPRRECCWIAELDGSNVGSAMLVEESETAAKLRLLLVEPRARGLGIGSQMVQECVRFARQAGYKKIALWTNSILVGARRLYQSAGFRMVEAQPHHSFGRDLIGENWELVL